MASNGFWENPCGFEDDLDLDKDSEVSQEELRITFGNAIGTLSVARRHCMGNFSFVSTKYSFIELETIDSISYEFLKVPDIEKENITKQSVLDVFHLLQKFAVSLDVIKEESEDDISYTDLLQEIEEKIVQVLCSLEMLLLDLQLQKQEKITKSIASDLTNLSGSEKAVRDLVVMRDYLKAIVFAETVLRAVNDHYFMNAY